MMYGFPDSIKGWKGQFFFMKKTMLRIEGELEWRVTGKVKYPPRGSGEYNTISVRWISPLIFNARKLTKRVLIVTCMSPVPASLAFPLKKTAKE